MLADLARPDGVRFEQALERYQTFAESSLIEVNAALAGRLRKKPRERYEKLKPQIEYLKLVVDNALQEFETTESSARTGRLFGLGTLLGMQLANIGNCIQYVIETERNSAQRARGKQKLLSSDHEVALIKQLAEPHFAAGDTEDSVYIQVAAELKNLGMAGVSKDTVRRRLSGG